MSNINTQTNPMRLTSILIVLAAFALLQAIIATPRALAAESCPNQAVRKQQRATYLPDCRAFEQVSPVQKDGNEVIHPLSGYDNDPFQAAAEGAAIAYTATGAFPGALSSGTESQYLSSSASLGSPWRTLPLSPFGSLDPRKTSRAPSKFVYYSPDLSCGIVESNLPLTPLPAGESADEYVENFYVWNAVNGSYKLVTDLKPEGDGEGVVVDGTSANCSHVLFASNEFEYLAEKIQLLEWDEGTLSVASLLPDGMPPEEGITDNHEKSEFNNGRSDLNELSSEGSRVFFTAYANEGFEELECEEECEEVFMRLDGGKAIEVSESDTATPDEGAHFQIASKNGEQILFTANYGLTSRSSSGATECKSSGKGCDLYSYNTATETLTDISADPNSADATGADVLGVLGISEEGSVVYFSASGQLVAGEGRTEEENEDKEEANVYAYSDGQLSYVASIGATEAGHGNGETDEQVDAIDPVSNLGAKYTVSRVSGGGEYLLFATSKPITQTDGVTYENIDAATGKADFEDYEYSLALSSVTCVSCDPSGTQPQLRAGAALFEGTSNQYEENTDGEMSRDLADDGSVFFQTSNRLLPQAVDDTDNVYEWEPEGVGTCPSGQQAGCVSILDSGTDPNASYFEGASANGESVYLTTYEKLAPLEDTDGLRDLYDVRVDGGFLHASTEECSGEECQGPLPAQEATQTPGSTLGSGNGNVSTKTVTTTTSPTVTVVSKKVSGSTLKLKVKVSAAGKLTVTGTDVSKVAKTAKGRSTLTFSVELTKAQAAKLAKGKRVKAKLTLTYAPKSGKKITKKVKVSFAPKAKGKRK